MADRLRSGRERLLQFHEALEAAVPSHIQRPLITFLTYRQGIVPRHFLLRADAVICVGSYLAHAEGSQSYLMRLQDKTGGFYNLFDKEIEYVRESLTIPYDMAGSTLGEDPSQS